MEKEGNKLGLPAAVFYLLLLCLATLSGIIKEVNQKGCQLKISIYFSSAGRLKFSAGFFSGYLLLIFILLSPAAAAKKDIEIVLEEKRLEGLSSSGLTINFVLRVVNNSVVEYQLARTTHRVLVNQEEFFRIDTPVEPAIPIPAASSTLITVPVKITYDYLFQTIPVLKGEERFNCLLTGLFSFLDPRRRELKVPLAVAADFPLFHDWKIDFLPLQVKSLSLGGAEVEFGVRFINCDASNWILRRLSYRLEFSGKPIQSGEQTFQDSVGPGEGKKLVLSLLLDFFELGPELAPALESEAIEVNFSGEIEMESEWGRFQWPFVSRQKLAVVRQSREIGAGTKSISIN